MKKYQFIVFFISALLLTGCASNKLIEIGENSDCETSIEGSYNAPQIYKHVGPAIVFPQKHELRYQEGDIIHNDSTGVLLLKKKSGLLGKRDTIYYRYDEIRAIVDEEKICVWGDLEEYDRVKMDITIYLTNLDDSLYQPLTIEVSRHKKFSYCAKPGRYNITGMLLTMQDTEGKHRFLASLNPVVQFEVKPDVANYLGNIRFQFGDQTKPNISRKINPGGLLIGVALAVVTGVVAPALISGQSASIPKSVFNFEHEPNFQSVTGKKVEYTEVYLPK